MTEQPAIKSATQLTEPFISTVSQNVDVVEFWLAWPVRRDEKKKNSEMPMTCVEVVYKKWPWSNKITAQLYTQCIAMLSLPNLPNVQIISTAQRASPPNKVICSTTTKWEVTAELLTSGPVRNRKKMGRRQWACPVYSSFPLLHLQRPWEI